MILLCWEDSNVFLHLPFIRSLGNRDICILTYLNVKKTVTDKIQISIMLMPYFFCESPHIMRTDLAFKTFSLEASDTGLTAVGSWGHFMVMHGLVARISHVRSHGLHWVFLKSREGLINHIERQSFELMKKSVK